MSRTLKALAIVGVLAGLFAFGGVRKAEAARIHRVRRHRRHHSGHRRYRHHRPYRYVYGSSRTYVYYGSPSVQYVTPSYTYATTPSVVYYNSYSDASIQANVLHMLATRFPGAIRKLRLKVKRGEVDIDGKVGSYHMRNLIESAVCQIPGVRRVDNDLDVDN